MADVNWYAIGLATYDDRTKYTEILLDFLRTKSDELKFGDRRTFLSIGPANGNIDVPLLENDLTKVDHYIAVEPNGEEAKLLQGRLDNHLKHRDIQTEVIVNLAEDWNGPKEAVDLILLSHVLYYIKDRKMLLQRCMEWLAPGGTMIVIHGGEGGIIGPVAKHFGGSSHVYCGNQVRQDLAELQFGDVKYDTVYEHIDIRDRNTDVMNFILNKKATQHELKALDTFLSELIPSGVDQEANDVYWWTKE